MLVLATLVAACSKGERDSGPSPASSASTSISASSSSAAAAISAPIPSASTAPSPSVPDVDTIPWETGDGIGVGIARKDTENPRGENVLVAWAGWKVSLESAEIWATALYRASLEKRGVRWIWAVQGPKHPLYRDKELGTEKLAAAIVPIVSAKTKFIVGVAHSSGALVASELFARLANGGDPLETTLGRIVYFDLDGEEGSLGMAIVGRLRRAYFVGAYDGAIATASHEDEKMRRAGLKYAKAGGYFRQLVSDSGCERGAGWCMHMTLVTTKPHDPRKAQEVDFSDFVGRDVANAYLEEKAAEAGLDGD